MEKWKNGKMEKWKRGKGKKEKREKDMYLRECRVEFDGIR
jgi:hypothetical protein